MSKVSQRLLTFFIGIPLVVGAIYPAFMNHIVINSVAVVFSVLCAIELHNLFSVKAKMPPVWFCAALSAVLPLTTYLWLEFFPESIDNYTHWVFIFVCLVILVYEVFAHKTFEDSNHRLTATIFLVFYCGFLLTFITRMSLFKNATIILSLFLVTTFMNDSIAWFFGVLFGKNNRGKIAASPNKSIAGFIGGYAGSVLTCILASFLFADIFGKNTLTMNIIKAVSLGVITATAGIIGDLTESVFKRSAGKKDSGTLMPGRGGILDSCDSILFGAPVFYIAVTLLYHPELITSAQTIAETIVNPL